MPALFAVEVLAVVLFAVVFAAPAQADRSSANEVMQRAEEVAVFKIFRFTFPKLDYMDYVAVSQGRDAREKLETGCAALSDA